MLGFMKKTKHIRHKTESEGIYLSELNSDDPEMASLYFPSAYKQTNTSTQAGKKQINLQFQSFFIYINDLLCIKYFTLSHYFHYR